MVHRAPWSLLLVFCLLWQTLAFAGPAVSQWEAGGAAGDVKHQLLHLSGQPHHHHHGEGVHHDDSPESLQHLHVDCLSSATFILPASPITGAIDAPHDPVPVFSGRTLPHPFLEGLRKPPRPLA